MHYRHHVVGLGSAIGAAGLVAGMVLSGGISAALSPASPAPAAVTGSQPHQAALMAIVITDPPGKPEGPKAVGTDPSPATTPLPAARGDSPPDQVPTLTVLR